MPPLMSNRESEYFIFVLLYTDRRYSDRVLPHVGSAENGEKLTKRGKYAERYGCVAVALVVDKYSAGALLDLASIFIYTLDNLDENIFYLDRLVYHRLETGCRVVGRVIKSDLVLFVISCYRAVTSFCGGGELNDKVLIVLEYCG